MKKTFWWNNTLCTKETPLAVFANYRFSFCVFEFRKCRDLATRSNDCSIF